MYARLTDKFHSWRVSDILTYGLNIETLEGALQFAAAMESAITGMAKASKKKDKSKDKKESKSSTKKAAPSGADESARPSATSKPTDALPSHPSPASPSGPSPSHVEDKHVPPSDFLAAQLAARHERLLMRLDMAGAPMPVPPPGPAAAPSTADPRISPYETLIAQAKAAIYQYRNGGWNPVVDGVLSDIKLYLDSINGAYRVISTSVSNPSLVRITMDFRELKRIGSG